MIKWNCDYNKWEQWPSRRFRYWDMGSGSFCSSHFKHFYWQSATSTISYIDKARPLLYPILTKRDRYYILYWQSATATISFIDKARPLVYPILTKRDRYFIELSNQCLFVSFSEWNSMLYLCRCSHHLGTLYKNRRCCSVEERSPREREVVGLIPDRFIQGRYKNGIICLLS